MSGPPPMYPPPMAPPPAAPRRRSAAGTAVVVVLVVAALLCLGVGTAGYLLVVRVPHGADSPTGAASGLLTAIFRSQSADDAGTYICAERRDAQSVQDLLSQAAQYEQSGRISWSRPRVVGRHDGSVKVAATLTVASQSGDRHGESRRWRFSTVDERGWRVCEIHS